MSLAGWNAGLASVDITPSEPIWLSGWGGRTTPSIGVQTPVHVKALALQHGDGPLSVLVNSDLMAYSAPFVEKVAEHARQKFGIERARLALMASHNHSAPVTSDVLPLYYDFTPDQQAVIDRYTQGLYGKFIEAIEKAIADQQPATLAFGNNMAGFATNRRRIRPGGAALPGVVDQDVPVMVVRRASGELRGLLFGYACHTTCVQDDTINGDYAGFAREELEQKYPGAIAMFIAGCGGDQGPHPRFITELGRLYGHVLATAVSDVAEPRGVEPPVTVEGPLGAAIETPRLKLQPAPTRQELEALLPGRTGTQLREVKHQIALLDAGKPLISEVPYAIQVWRFGSGHTWVILSSEVVVDYSLKFKQRFGFESTWVMAYANDHIAYIPSLRILNEGGYEGATGMMECGFPSPFTADVEDVIGDTVNRLWQQADPAKKK